MSNNMINLIWGAIFGVWVGLVLKNCLSVPPSYDIYLFCVIFLFFMSFIIYFFYRSLKLESWLHYIVTIFCGIALTGFIWFFVNHMNNINKSFQLINFPQIAFIVLILVFWIFTIEYCKKDI